MMMMMMMTTTTMAKLVSYVLLVPRFHRFDEFIELLSTHKLPVFTERDAMQLEQRVQASSVNNRVKRMGSVKHAIAKAQASLTGGADESDTENSSEDEGSGDCGGVEGQTEDDVQMSISARQGDLRALTSGALASPFRALIAH